MNNFEQRSFITELFFIKALTVEQICKDVADRIEAGEIEGTDLKGVPIRQGSLHFIFDRPLIFN